MNLSELKEFRALETGNHSQHAGLLAIPQMVLKANQAVSVGH